MKALGTEFMSFEKYMTFKIIIIILIDLFLYYVYKRLTLMYIRVPHS